MGFAEADPTMDVDGTDAAQKLAILAHLAFGADSASGLKYRVPGSTGSIRPTCVGAIELGYRVKLLAIAQLAPGRTGAARLADTGQNRHTAGRSRAAQQRR